MNPENDMVNFESALLTMRLYFGNEISACNKKFVSSVNEIIPPPLYHFDGASDRILAHVSSISIVYLAGLLGWGGKKIPSNVIRSGIIAALYHRKSNAHRLVSLGNKLALEINKAGQVCNNDKDFAIRLEKLSVKEAVFQIHKSIKVMLKDKGKPLTLEGLASILSGSENCATEKSACAQIIDILNMDGHRINDSDLKNILDIINIKLLKIDK